MLVYLASPIDQADNGRYNSKHDIHRALIQAGLSTYVPSDAFVVSQPTLNDMSIIQRINEFSLYAADALVVWLPSSVATLGVPAEIEKSLAAGKRVLILTDSHLMFKSVQLNAWRELGATVLEWDDARATRWIEDPKSWVDLLLDKPDSMPREMLDTSTFGVAGLTPGREVSGSQPQLLVRYDDPHAPTLVPGRYEGDAGIDLAINADAHLASGEYKLLPTGAHVAIPDGYFGLITGRSSTWAKHRCAVVQAVIDSGYRGELMVGIQNYASPVLFEAGTRLAQIVLLPVFPGGVVQVDELPPSQRGLSGYGSTGK